MKPVLEKTLELMVVREVGKVTEDRVVQPEKELFPRVFTPSGMSKLVNLVQP